MKTKCLIVDDEPLAIEVIKSHIGKIDTFQVIANCKNAFEAYNVLKETKIDLMFLDIHMPEMKGTDLIKGLQHPPMIILTTAYREYALEGYDLNVLDYLLKPISFERFLKAVNKYNNYHSHKSDVSVHLNNKNEEDFIYVRDNNEVHKFTTSNILYMESFGDHLTIHSNTGSVTVRCTLSSMEQQMPEGEFIRIHRSYIVSRRHITKFTISSITVANHELPIGPSYKNEVFKTLKYNSFLK